VKVAVRSLGELGPDYALAPERHVLLAGESQDPGGVPLGDLVVERGARIVASATGAAVVLDTSHARDGVLDVAGALRDGAGGKSAKKGALAGDVVVSRLRPYLRQVALVHPGALAVVSDRPLALSTEFYVLAPKKEGEDLAFLLPFLLSGATQAALAAAQEGGHHPRVPRASLFALRVPLRLVRGRALTSRAVNEALAAGYRASARLRRLLGR
jgi:hypothetical protein